MRMQDKPPVMMDITVCVCVFRLYNMHVDDAADIDWDEVAGLIG